MRAVYALMILVGMPLAASANDGFSVVIPMRAGVPIIINGIDASYAVVESDWGLAKNVHIQPTVYGGRRIEAEPDVAWRSEAETRRLLALMSPVNLAKVEAAQQAGRRMVGGVYRRTRRNHNGAKVQRAEVRFDDVSGCLRTPAGGSSRQVILVVEGERVRSRLISARETARLMGLPDGYRLPGAYNDAYHLTGDGVAVDVVRHLARHIFEPILGAAAPLREVA